MPTKFYKNRATFCLKNGKKYWTEIISKRDIDCAIRGRKGSTVSWTYLTHIGMSDVEGESRIGHKGTGM